MQSKWRRGLPAAPIPSLTPQSRLACQLPLRGRLSPPPLGEVPAKQAEGAPPAEGIAAVTPFSLPFGQPAPPKGAPFASPSGGGACEAGGRGQGQKVCARQYPPQPPAATAPPKGAPFASPSGGGACEAGGRGPAGRRNCSSAPLSLPFRQPAPPKGAPFASPSGGGGPKGR